MNSPAMGARRVEVYGSHVLVSQCGDDANHPSRWLSREDATVYLRSVLEVIEHHE